MNIYNKTQPNFISENLTIQILFIFSIEADYLLFLVRLIAYSMNKTLSLNYHFLKSNLLEKLIVKLRSHIEATVNFDHCNQDLSAEQTILF